MPEFLQARKNMVDCQIRPADVTNTAIISAMLEIPREKFVVSTRQSLAYIDEDISLETSTQGFPRYLMEAAPFARLLQLAQIQPDAIVLDVGCATGYSTAILSKLCTSIVALEPDANLAAKATQTLMDLEIGNGVVLTAPLEKGYAREGPYDVIFIGGAVDFVPDALLSQLKDGGKLVAVMGTGNTGRAVLYVRNDGNTSMDTHFNCAVWPMPGFKKHKEFEF